MPTSTLNIDPAPLASTFDDLRATLSVQVAPPPLVVPGLGAGAPAPVLHRALVRAGSGVLAGRAYRGCRDVLRALVDHLLPAGSAEGYSTVEQVASVAGLSYRHTGRCLALLEQEFGILFWRRGYVDHGTPRPSWFRVNKDVLLFHIAVARKIRTKAVQVWKALFAARRDRYNLHHTRPYRPPHRPPPAQTPNNRRSVHVDMTTPLLPTGGGPAPRSAGPPGPDPRDEGPPVPPNAAFRAMREAMRAGRTGERVG